MVTARFTCLRCYCVCSLPTRVALRSSARLVVALLAGLIFLLALLPLSLSILIASSDASRGELSPSVFSQLLFLASCAMIACACAGCCAACSPPTHSLGRRSLCLMILLTLVTLVLLALGTAVSFVRAGIVRWTSLDQIVGATDALQASLLDNLQITFEAAYDDCDPVVYDTTQVRAACMNTIADSDCGRLKDHHLGLFCKNVPGPFSANSTLAFSHPDVGGLSYIPSEWGVLSSANRFASWWNHACMPDRSDANARYAELEDNYLVEKEPLHPRARRGAGDGMRKFGWDSIKEEQSSGDPIFPVTRGEQDPAKISKFVQCYASLWWPHKNLTRAVAFNATRYPNGSSIDPALQQGPKMPNGRGRAPPKGDATLFRLLNAMGPGFPFNAKLAFCFCEMQGEKIGLYEQDPTALRWFNLGSCIVFVLLALAAETYLCCSRFPRFTGDGRTLAQVEAEKNEKQKMLAHDEVEDFVSALHVSL